MTLRRDDFPGYLNISTKNGQGGALRQLNKKLIIRAPSILLTLYPLFL
jgi:hypothetical protein